ncbi:MAG: uroporphyrinogen-III C-methyltransferase [Betaproteobacteria bacterium]
MDPIPPTSAENAAPGNSPTQGRPLGSRPTPPLAKPVSRGVAAALVIALAGVAGLAWLDAHTSAQALRVEFTQRMAAEEAAIAQAKARDSDQTGELREAGAKVALVETRLSELQAQLASLEAQYQDIAPSRDEIVLTEVEQMLLLASQQLSLAANVPAAIAALQLADARLAGTNRTALTPLRRALGRDMDRLKAVPTADVPGIAVKLDRALATIDTLPLAQDERLPDPTPQTLSPAAAEPAWRGLLRGMWNDLKSVVRIEVSDRAAAPLVTPAQAYFLRENLRLRLLSARVALLTRDETSFKSDIAAANAWVKKYFDIRAKPVLALTATLTQLGLTAMPAEMPDVNESLTALRTLKASKERTSVRAASAPSAPVRAP